MQIDSSMEQVSISPDLFFDLLTNDLDLSRATEELTARQPSRDARRVPLAPFNIPQAVDRLSLVEKRKQVTLLHFLTTSTHSIPSL